MTNIPVIAHTAPTKRPPKIEKYSLSRLQTVLSGSF